MDPHAGTVAGSERRAATYDARPEVAEADLCRSAPVGAESVFRAAGFALVADAPGTVEATVGAIAEATASATAALLTAPRRLPGCCPAWALHDRHAAAETQPVYRPRTAAYSLSFAR